MWICQVRAVTTRKTSKFYWLTKQPRLHLLCLSYLYLSCWDQSSLLDFLTKGNLVSVSIPLTRKACEGDVIENRRGVHCIHLLLVRTQLCGSTSR